MLHTIATPQVKAWHSAQFTWDGTRITFGDEAGGGVIARCRAEDPPTTGAVWTYDVATAAELGHYKIPRFETGTCTMHNFIYESSITEGVNIYRLSGNTTGVAIRLPHLNPQTQEFSLP